MISTALSLNFSGAAGRARIASKRSVGGAQRNPRLERTHEANAPFREEYVGFTPRYVH